jgi:chromosomal replication initiation ATPase DnaA
MQLHFKFDKNHNYSEENFVVSESNKDAFEFITGQHEIEIYSKFFAIVGEAGAGKTHLAHILQNRIGAKFINLEEFKNQSTEQFYKNLSKIIQKDRAYILEDIEEIDEEILLYIVNLIENKKAKLLMTSRKNLESLNFQIPDLKSRISNTVSFNIKLPEKDLIKAIIVKYLSEHGTPS